MSDTAYDFEGAIAQEAQDRASRGFRVDETYWGYVVQSTEPPSALTVITQALASFFGAAFVVASLMMWAMPSQLASDDSVMFRLAASVLTASAAALLLWYASRGTRVQVQIDRSLGEVREVVINRSSRATLLGRYSFDEIGSVFLDRHGRRDSRATLMLRLGNSAQKVPVVSGEELMIEPLQLRIARDLMIGSLRAAKFESVVPFEQRVLGRTG